MLLDHLSSHSLLFGFPTETRFLPYYILNQARFGDLGDDSNFLRLWHDIARLLSDAAGRTTGTMELPDNWRESERTTAGIFDGVMRQLAAPTGKAIWCEKTPMHVHHLELLAGAFPRAKFIHIIRDGRDCAASFHRRWGFNPERTIYRWKQAVRSGRTQGRKLEQRYHEVRYEALTSAAESVFREMCDFLHIPFEQAVMVAARPRSALRGSGAQTVGATGNRASRHFNDAEMAQLERVAGRCLAELGYPSTNESGDADPPHWKLRSWALADDLRRLAGILAARGRLFRPRRWAYVANRVRRMLKQRASLKS
jgi:hypothetical protein